jgi:hypothetical protein
VTNTRSFVARHVVVVSPNHAAQRLDEVHPAPVRTPAEPVRQVHVVFHPPNLREILEAIEPPARLHLLVVHRPRPQAPHGIAFRIVEAVVWSVAVRMQHRLEPFERHIGELHAALRKRHEPASRTGNQRTDPLRHGPGVGASRRRIERMQLQPLDVDPEDAGLRGQPHRALPHQRLRALHDLYRILVAHLCERYASSTLCTSAGGRRVHIAKSSRPSTRVFV